MIDTERKWLRLTRADNNSLRITSTWHRFERLFTAAEARELCAELPRLFPEYFPPPVVAVLGGRALIDDGQDRRGVSKA